MLGSILIVDPDGASAYDLKVELGSVRHRGTIAPTAETALKAIARQVPDLLVLELELPDRAGLEFLADIRASGYQFPVLVHTQRKGAAAEIAAFEAGANDFVHKGSKKAPQLLARIEAHLGRAPSNLRVDTRLIADPAKQSIATSAGTVHLTTLEWKLFAALYRAGGTFTTTAELKRRIWGIGSLRGSGRVWTCMSGLRAKLRSIRLSNRVVHRRGLGYAWDFGVEAEGERDG